jgi:hypothetical protein
LSFTGTGLLPEFPFPSRSWCGKEVGKRCLKDGTIVFLFDQTRGQRFAQEVTFDTDYPDSLQRIHALTHRDAQARGPECVNKA